MTNNRDDFNSKIKDALSKRASFICSNPNCKVLTIAPAEHENDKYVYIGVAAHITAAAPGGPRYDPIMSAENRSAIDNAIFLCQTCSAIIDKNNGVDYTTKQLKKWKTDHELWVRENLNKQQNSVIIDGEHNAEGIGDVTGLDIKGPALIQPGTKVTASGIGTITGTRIGSR